MSYAQAASKDAQQSAQDAMPNTDMPTNDSSQLEAQGKEAASETKQKAKEASETTKEKSESFAQEAKQKAREASSYSKEKGSEMADSASKNYDQAKKSASKGAKEAKEEMRSAGQDLKENQDNPVYIANGVLIVAGSAALGYGAYTKHAAGQLDWQLAGTWAAAVGVLAVGDYYLSQYLFKNKYPKK